LAGGQETKMDARIEQFIRENAKNLIGLDVALFYQANPNTFDSPEALARRTHRDDVEVKQAMDRLVEAGVLEVHARGEGRHQCYALVRTAAVWTLLCALSEAYLDDLESRKDIIRLLMKKPKGPDASAEDPRSSQTQ
jgi:hypothetical protein